MKNVRGKTGSWCFRFETSGGEETRQKQAGVGKTSVKAGGHGHAQGYAAPEFLNGKALAGGPNSSDLLDPVP